MFDFISISFYFKNKQTQFEAVLVNVSNQKPPLLEPKTAKTRPKNFT